MVTFKFPRKVDIKTYFLLSLAIMTLLSTGANGQFFTKTSKSVPRMGRRADPLVSPLPIDMVTLSEMIKMTKKYDMDGDESLSADELYNIPLLRMAIGLQRLPSQQSRLFNGLLSDDNRRQQNEMNWGPSKRR